jgi:plasmid stabilization system protein ParE
MTYRVELTPRASRNLRRIYGEISAADSELARAWFNGLEVAISSLDENPARSPITPEDESLRHLLYGSRRYVYRINYTIDERRMVVVVLHIRHGSRRPYTKEGDG